MHTSIEQGNIIIEFEQRVGDIKLVVGVATDCLIVCRAYKWTLEERMDAIEQLINIASAMNWSRSSLSMP